jgi:hypothetical protein
MAECCNCGNDCGVSRPGTNLLYCGDCWTSSNAIEFIMDTLAYLFGKTNDKV